MSRQKKKTQLRYTCFTIFEDTARLNSLVLIYREMCQLHFSRGCLKKHALVILFKWDHHISGTISNAIQISWSKTVGYLKLFWIKKGNQKCAQKNTLALKWTWDRLFRLSLGKKRRKKIQMQHTRHKATGMTICRAKTTTSNSPSIFTN